MLLVCDSCVICVRYFSTLLFVLVFIFSFFFLFRVHFWYYPPPLPYHTQVNVLGSRSRLSLDVQCPTDEVHAAALLSNVDHAVAKALGGEGMGGGIPGPVHLNFMFRENLAPVDGAIR